MTTLTEILTVPRDNLAAFAARLRELREYRGFTQSSFGVKIGMSQSLYSKYENADKDPGSVMLRRFADALGVHPGDLLSDPGSPLISGEKLSDD